jgi:hypothetical protein
VVTAAGLRDRSGYLSLASTFLYFQREANYCYLGIC